METSVSNKARKVAKVIGWTHFVVHNIGLLFATGLLIYTLWMGYQSYGTFSATETSDTFAQAEVSEAAVYLCLCGTATAISFAISGSQSYGAYMLLQATRMNAKPSEAILKINSYRKIQMVFLWIDLAIIIPPTLMIREALFSFPILFMLTLFVFHFVSVQTVDWFRADLKKAAAADCKRMEKQNVDENKGAEPFIMSAYTTE